MEPTMHGASLAGCGDALLEGLGGQLESSSGQEGADVTADVTADVREGTLGLGD